jgi:chromate transporter
VAGVCFILPAAAVIAIIVYAVIALLRSVIKGVWLGALAVAALVAYLFGVNELILLATGARVPRAPGRRI